jgi:hypothetical protein
MDNQSTSGLAEREPTADGEQSEINTRGWKKLVLSLKETDWRQTG